MRVSDQMAAERQQYEELREQLTVDGALLHLSQLLRRAALLFGDSVALIELDRQLTYMELYQRSSALTAELIRRGVVADDRIMMLCQNSIEFYLFYFGILQTGAIAVPVNTFLSKPELEHIVRDCQPKFILASDQLRSLAESCAQQITVLGTELLDAKCESPLVLKDVIGDGIQKPSLILYTSGTTGLPRGVMLSSLNVMSNALQVAVRFKGFDCWRERFFAVLPLFHVFAQNACIWLPLLTGSTVIVVPRIERGAIRRGLELRPTVFLGFPALYGLLCLMRNAPLAGVKVFVSGADAMPARIRGAFAMLYGRAICSGYGLTEASPAIAVDLGDQTAPTESVGPLLAGVDGQVRGPDGMPVEDGHVGTLWVRGNNVMMGYYRSPEATAKVMSNGWLDTGDLARIGTDGQVAICGREKDLIIHKGLNIYPQEIEQVLATHPMVSQVAVIGCPDEDHGQVPVAFVVLKGMMHGAKSVLTKFCKERLATYKVPRSILCVDDLPLNATGKIDKKALGRLLSTV